MTTVAPPPWLVPLIAAVDGLTSRDLSRIEAPAEGGRESAVLVLFGDGNDGPDVLVIERSAGSRQHAGQAAFPGGAVEPDDDGPASTALREAAEETGLDWTDHGGMVVNCHGMGDVAVLRGGMRGWRTGS